MLAVWFAVGCAAGAVVAWLIANGRAQGTNAELAVRESELAGLRTLIEEKERSLTAKEDELRAEREAGRAAGEELAGVRAKLEATGEKIQALMDVETSLKDSFKALAASALDANSQQLLQLSQQQLENQQRQATSKLNEKQTAIETLLKPMQESLANLSAHSQSLEVKREGAYADVLAEVKNIRSSQADLRRETTQLVAALRAPKARGNWGELQLKKCVEFAGMVQYASFDVERFVRGDDAGYRPDLVVKMPNGRTIIVDAKTPLDAFLDASNAEDEVVRTGKLVAHAARVREHLKDLSSKAYWRQFVDSPDFVVCFLPSEVLFSAALEQDPSLIEFSASSGVLLATPTTLIALLKAVAFGWQQSEIAKNADAIRDTALAVYGKLAGIYEDFIDLGNRLKAAGGCYDDIVTKIDGRGGVFAIARKLRELGIGEKDLEDSKKGRLKAAGLTLRSMESEDWQPGLALAAESEDAAE
jgi:DNA recombination protein RmuC